MRASSTQSLVRRLLIYEAAESRNQEALLAAAERVSDKLRVHLSQRIGQEGFRTLLARALTLTTARSPYLSAVRVEADGSLAGLLSAADTAEGAEALLAQLLELLMTFIGEHLTVRILSAVWPEIAWDDLTDGENEKP